jgi:hypothetical protein
MLAKRAYKCLFYPTPTQEQALAQHFECVKFVYNQMPVRRRQRHKDGECSCYGEDAAALTALKRTPDTCGYETSPSSRFRPCCGTSISPTAISSRSARNSHASSVNTPARATRSCAMTLRCSRRAYPREDEEATGRPLEPRTAWRPAQSDGLTRPGRPVYHRSAVRG